MGMLLRRHSDTPCAVVTGGQINGLGLVRSLAREGVPTLLLDTDHRDPSMHTRYGRKLEISSLEGAQLIEELLQVRSGFSSAPVLFLTQEKSVFAVARHLDRIAEAYRLSMPAASVMDSLMDKAHFQSLAERLGFAVPRAALLRDTRDLSQAHRLTFPCVLKPFSRTGIVDPNRPKAFRVESCGDLERILEDLDYPPDFILQEWIEGGDDSIYFCLQFRSREGVALASFTGRKLRSWPPRIGGTASCVPAPEHAAALTEQTDAFFSAAGFVGMGSMEFKRDTRTGRFVMIEPTVGRTDFQEEIATLNGVNLPYIAYCYEAGMRPDDRTPSSPPASWAISPEDRWSEELQPDGMRGFPAGLRRYDAVWRLGDPLPWCYAFARRCKQSFEARKWF